MPGSSTVRAAIYARVSTSGQGQDVGLQLDELRALAAQRGWTVAEYIDDGVSGSTRERPGLNRLLKDARTGRVDLVAIWKLDRLACSVAHLLDLTDQFQSWGVGLVSARDAHIDTTTPAGRFTLQILGAVAELERGLIRERVQAGVDRARAAGTHCGRPRAELDLRPAVAMLDQGYGLKAASRALGVPMSTLRRRLTEAGAWPREGAEGGWAPPARGGWTAG